MQANEETDAGQQDEDSAQDLGVRLRAARNAQELSLEDLAAELRIPRHNLEALEQGRYESLGAPVFAKGYLKQYAARLGLDVAAVAEEYDRTAGRPGIDLAPSRTIRLRDERQITIWVVAGLALALLVVFLLLWWVRQDDEPAAPAVIPATAGQIEPTEADSPPAGTAPSSALSAGSAAAVETASRPDETARGAGAASGPAAAAAASVSDASIPAETPPTSVPESVDTPTEPEVVSTPAASGSSPASAPITGPVLEVIFHEDSWAEITAADGEQLFYNLGRAGTSLRLPAAPDTNLFFGNAPGVEIRIDGVVRPIPPAARRRDDLAQFDLGALLN